MLTSPWDLILTVLFVATGGWCAVDLVIHRARLRTQDGTIAQHAIIAINHLVMSAAMLLMIWVATIVDAATWAQVAVFAIFSVALLPGIVGRVGAAHRISLLGHVSMNAAMIWMLLAMPLLMAGMTMGGGDAPAHHGGGMTALPTSTPVWADIVNWAFVAVSAVAALWWTYELLRSRGRHLHLLCHAGMAAGMGLMLVVMNA